MCTIICLLYSHNEAGMRAGWASIHVCRADWPILTSLDKTLVHFCFFGDINLSDVLDVDTLASFLTNFQILRRRIY